MSIRTSFIIFLIAALQSCKTESNSTIVTSDVSGYSYEVFEKGDGVTPKIGDFIYFDMDLYDHQDSLLQSFRSQDPIPSIEILAQEDVNRKRNPLVDIASYLSIGDSVAIIVPADSVGGMPPGMEGTPHIEYHIVPAEILTAEQQQEKMAQLNAERMAAMEEMRKELPRVEELTERTLGEYKSGQLDVQETTNGVKYVIHERGDGELPTPQSMVTMNYYGKSVSTGERFDDSFSRGRGYSFRVANDQVITGWHEIAPYLPLGSKASVFIPSELGYGATGSPPNIAPNEELYFYMEVVELYY